MRRLLCMRATYLASLGLLAVPLTMEHAEKSDPRAYRFAILVSERSRDLVQMGHVVRSPC